MRSAWSGPLGLELPATEALRAGRPVLPRTPSSILYRAAIRRNAWRRRAPGGPYRHRTAGCRDSRRAALRRGRARDRVRVIDDGGRLTTAPRAVITSDRPAITLLRPPAPWVEHRHDGLVGEDARRGPHHLAQPRHYRGNLGRSIPDPERQRGVARRECRGQSIQCRIHQQADRPQWMILRHQNSPGSRN